MSLKDRFTPDEWFQVMTAPGRVGAAVVAASPSGVTGLVAEAQAIGAAIRESLSAADRTPLLEAMAADLLGTPPSPQEVSPQDRPRTPEEVRARSLEEVRRAAWLVGAKAGPGDLAAFRRLLLNVAERAAAAAKEGGFLGFGGEQVNERERQVLAELRTILGEEGAPAPPHETPPGGNPDGSGNSN
ncbi:hypothetical protein [Deinococcus murrayi]|uniref:hypothetical protein n=1 Tax=Deinococcus murrayi TaxID=68910 RepID=UPI00047F1675|nr:hypothetical protein [Deinococcus murrayi]